MSFFSNVFVTLRGAVIGQIVPIIALPILSRIYDPITFGIFGSVMSLAVILSTLAMMQLEVAVVLPTEEKKAENIARTALQMGLYILLTLTVGLVLFFSLAIHSSTFGHLSWWIACSPLVAFLLALVWLCNYCAIRHQQFKEIGQSAAVVQIGYCASAIALGAVLPTIGSLVIARIAGQLSAIASYRTSMRWLLDIFHTQGWATWQTLRQIIRENRKFPLFSMPYAFTSTLSREVVSIILIFFNHPLAAGFYTLTRSILLMPSSLLSTSIGQIFYREASKSLHNPQFRSFIYTLIMAIAAIAAPACVFVAQWAPDIFTFIFGEAWREAGSYAILFMPVAFLYMLTIWVGRIFEITGRQDILFRTQIVFDAASIAILVYSLVSGLDVYHAVASYIACQIVYFTVYLGFVFKLMNLNLMQFFGLAGAALLCGASILALDGFLRHLSLTLLSVFLLEACITAMICTAFLILAWRRMARNPFLSPQNPVIPPAADDIVC